MMSNTIACPICKKSMVDPKLFEKEMDLQHANMPMPEDYKNTKMMILCNDCLAKSKIPFHILPGKC